MFGHNDDDSTQQDNTTTDHVITVPDTAPPTNDSSWQHPGNPLDDKDHEPDIDAIAPPPASAIAPDNDKHDDDLLTSENDLASIKQAALSQLSPLMQHLDQPPEEKFRTIMMMIQASDDQTLIKDAYEIAKKIDDQKVRARALLDIVNEINYFTQHTPN